MRDILGLADRERSFDLLDLAMRGDASGALGIMGEDYANGADPIIVLRDLLEVVHWLTRVKMTPALADDVANPESERVRGTDLAGRLSIASLSRTWQMLLKGLQEAQNAPSPIQAAEMILIRLAYLSDLPSPADAVKSLQGGGAAQGPSGRPTAASDTGAHPRFKRSRRQLLRNQHPKPALKRNYNSSIHNRKLKILNKSLPSWTRRMNAFFGQIW